MRNNREERNQEYNRRNRYRREEENRYGNDLRYGPGSYAGELDRDYGPNGTFRGERGRYRSYEAEQERNRERIQNYGGSGYIRYQEMGGYDRSHQLTGDTGAGSENHYGYRSAPQPARARRTEHYSGRYRQERGPDRDQNDRYRNQDPYREARAQREEALERRRNVAHYHPGNAYRSEGDRASYQSSRGQQEQRERRYSGYGQERSFGNPAYERRGYGPGRGEEEARGQEYNRHFYRNLKGNYDPSERENSDRYWNRGYGAAASNFSGTSTYRYGNPYYRDGRYHYDREREEYERNRREDEERGLLEKAGDRIRSFFGSND